MLDWKKLLVSIIGCELAGGIGAIFTSPNIPTWYAALAKPSFSPPNWVFFPVWTTLYLMMGVSVYLVWNREKNKQAEMGLKFFGVQLLLNILWSFLFFGMKSPFLGLIGIIALWLSIALTIRQFWKINRNAAYLLVPYILWVSFAAILNFSVWQLNP
ncbi:MAG: TspO/MBR family protein [Candidatus Micrarchaeota archaeon]